MMVEENFQGGGGGEEEEKKTPSRSFIALILSLNGL